MTLQTEIDDASSDLWSRWILRDRHGEDETGGRVIRPILEAYADRAIDGARLKAGDTLMDLGSGDGLIPFRATDRYGKDLKIIVTDISAPLLHLTQVKAMEQGLQDDYRFVQCSADNLECFASHSVDAVTARSVLAYVPNKAKAFAECFRVIRPGGRLSIVEPIFQDQSLELMAIRNALDATPIEKQDRMTRLSCQWRATQFPDTMAAMLQTPITSYNERDLVQFAQRAGFEAIHMELHIDIVRSYSSWKICLDSAPHPYAPTLASALETLFSPDDRIFFEECLKRQIEEGGTPTTTRMAYLTAIKPTA